MYARLSSRHVPVCLVRFLWYAPHCRQSPGRLPSSPSYTSSGSTRSGSWHPPRPPPTASYDTAAAPVPSRSAYAFRQLDIDETTHTPYQHKHKHYYYSIHMSVPPPPSLLSLYLSLSAVLSTLSLSLSLSPYSSFMIFSHFSTSPSLFLSESMCVSYSRTLNDGIVLPLARSLALLLTQIDTNQKP